MGKLRKLILSVKEPLQTVKLFPKVELSLFAVFALLQTTVFLMHLLPNPTAAAALWRHTLREHALSLLLILFQVFFNVIFIKFDFPDNSHHIHPIYLGVLLLLVHMYSLSVGTGDVSKQPIYRQPVVLIALCNALTSLFSWYLASEVDSFAKLPMLAEFTALGAVLLLFKVCVLHARSARAGCCVCVCVCVCMCVFFSDFVLTPHPWMLSVVHPYIYIYVCVCVCVCVRVWVWHCVAHVDSLIIVFLLLAQCNIACQLTSFHSRTTVVRLYSGLLALVYLYDWTQVGSV
jgi:hypothetical protein